jgi:hypothetical protein
VTATMIHDHQTAVRTVLNNAGVAYLTGQVPDTPVFPYRVVRFGVGFDAASKLCNVSDRHEFWFYVTSVAESDEGVAITADVTRFVLADARLIVPGYNVSPIKRTTSTPITADDSVTNPVTGLHPMFAVDTYHFVSHAD